MATVIKGNTMLTIPDNRLADYLERGYDIANNAGIVIKKAIPTDTAELQKLYTEQVAKIANLEKQVAEYDELQANYRQLLKSYEELDERNAELEAELLKLKEAPKEAPKKTKRKTTDAE